MNWPQYVAHMSGGETQAAIGHKIGVSSASVSRWGSSAPKPENVAAFARAYNRPILEAFVAAGFLTPDEAKQRPADRPDPAQLSVDELLSEVRRRIEGAHSAAAPPSGNVPLPADYYDLAAHPQTDSPGMREHAEGMERGEESQNFPDD